MTTKAEWNEKWKALRIQLVAEHPACVANLFENTVIMDAWETREPINDSEGEYTDEDEFSWTIIFEKNREKIELNIDDYRATTINNQTFREKFNMNDEEIKRLTHFFEQEFPFEQIVDGIERENREKRRSLGMSFRW